MYNMNVCMWILVCRRPYKIFNLYKFMKKYYVSCKRRGQVEFFDVKRWLADYTGQQKCLMSLWDEIRGLFKK